MPFGLRRFLALLATAAVTALLLTAVNAGAAAAAPGTWLSRINTYRAANGRVRLAEDHQASRVAQAWTLQMVAMRRVAHNPLYKGQVTTPRFHISENVGNGRSEAVVFQAFVRSSGHRTNVLRPEYNRVGIGHAVVDGQVWTTHVFLATRLATRAPTS